MHTIIYVNGGDFAGYDNGKSIDEWKQFGLFSHQKYLYKGYRYFDNQKDIVVVFDTKRWDVGDIARRKNNGFMGIREYILPEPKR